jgi:hypothetical protein
MLGAPSAVMRTCTGHCAPRCAAATPLHLAGRQTISRRSVTHQRQPARLSACRQTVCSALAQEVRADRPSWPLFKMERAGQCTSRSIKYMQPAAPTLSRDVQQGKLISKVEVPAFIPRADLCEQLTRWALGNAQDDGLANFGCAFDNKSASIMLWRAVSCANRIRWCRTHV